MKYWVTACLLLTMTLSAFAVEDGNVMYVGGTVSTLKEATLGKLDTNSQTELIFESSSGRIGIPFAGMDSYEISQQVARHLGVLPAIAVGLVKQRQRKHFLRIAFHDESNTPQVAIFEISKKMPSTLLAVLQQRAPQARKPPANEVHKSHP